MHIHCICGYSLCQRSNIAKVFILKLSVNYRILSYINIYIRKGSKIKHCKPFPLIIKPCKQTVTNA